MFWPWILPQAQVRESVILQWKSLKNYTHTLRAWFTLKMRWFQLSELWDWPWNPHFLIWESLFLFFCWCKVYWKEIFGWRVTNTNRLFPRSIISERPEFKGKKKPTIITVGLKQRKLCTVLSFSVSVKNLWYTEKTYVINSDPYF